MSEPSPLSEYDTFQRGVNEGERFALNSLAIVLQAALEKCAPQEIQGLIKAAKIVDLWIRLEQEDK